ncbi:S8 family serine peptidase [bacterium]|nr:S8 family serine peptidase [candidate division CSSED10-310 bacterium]
MKKLMIAGVMLLAMGITADARVGSPQNGHGLVPGRDYQPGQVLVKLIPELRELDADPSQVLSEYKLGLLKEYKKLGWFLMAIPENEPYGVVKTVDELLDDPRVEYATPNYLRYLEAWTPNDFFYVQGHLWNFDIIGMPDAWDMDTDPPLYGGDPDVVVAVIDSGVAYKDYQDTLSFPGTTVIHAKAPDFTGTNFWINTDEIADNGIDDDGNDYVDDREGYNWPYTSPYPCDDNEHGSHVSGTIAQATNNNPSGIEDDYSAAGMAFNCTIMPLKTGGRDGTSVMSDVAAAIQYAADNGAHVINMSLGSGYVGAYPPVSVEYEACQYAHDAGVMIFSSTGNDADTGAWSPSYQGIGYPAAYPSVIAVGASNNQETTGDPSTEYQSNFSQYGYTAELLAPSGSYTSLDHDGSGRVDITFQQTIKSRDWPDLTSFKIKGFYGTSMASPHAAAHGALLISYAKQMGWTMTNEDLRVLMGASAFDLNQNDHPGYDYYCGFGRIDVPASFTSDPDPTLVVREATVFEGTGQGNGNFRPEAGEMVSMNVDLMPLFGNVTNVQALITSTDPMITVHSTTINYPDTLCRERAVPTNPVVLTISSACPIHHEAEFQAVVSCSQESDRTYTFHAIMTPARVLYWKDDRFGGNSNWQDQPLLNALDAAGIAYDMHLTTPKISEDATEQFRYPWEEIRFTQLPTFDMLKQYDAVIWYIGQNGIAKKELANDLLPAVVEYLDNGGNMIVTGHEILYNMAHPPDAEDRVVWIDENSTPNPSDVNEYNAWFIYNYFRIAAIDHDNWYDTVMGSPGNPITRTIAASTLNLMVYNKKLEYNWWPDNLVPRDGAIPFMYSGPPVRPADTYPATTQQSYDDDQPVKMAERACGVMYQGDFRMIMCAFPLEAMSNPGELLVPAVNWLLTGIETAPEILVKIDTDYRRTSYNSLMSPPYGDPFDLHGYIFNPGAPVDGQRWVLMQIYDMFWCWPTWDSLTNGVAYMDTSIPSGHSRQTFLEFEWPDVDGSFDDIYFWFAHLTATGNLLGSFDYCVAGYY